MKSETTTFTSSKLPDSKRDLMVCTEHEKGAKWPFAITIGCVDEWLSEADFIALHKAMSVALRIRKRVTA